MSSWDDPSPFRFDGPVSPDFLIGRDGEVATLRAWARAGQSAVIVAPRRYGKTSLLRKLKADAQRLDSAPVIMVDLYDVASMTDLVLRLERAWSMDAPARLRSSLTKVFAGVQVGLNVFGTGFSMKLADRPDTDPLPALHTLLDLPRTAHHRGGRVVIVFDEFQSIAGVAGAEALIRSYVQQQQEVASYLFAGSQPAMLARIFGDQARPFYGQAQLFPLDRLAMEQLVPPVMRYFENTNRDAAAVSDVLAASEGHPQRAMLLAHLLWQRIQPGEPVTADLVDVVLSDAVDRVDQEVRGVLDGLSIVQTKTLRAVAEYGSPIAARPLRDLGLSKPAAQSAANVLAQRALIERDVDRRWRVIDPLLTRWIRARYPTRPS